MKVLPTMVVAAAMRPSISYADLESRVTGLIGRLAAVGANLSTTDAREMVDDAARLFEARGVVVIEDGRFRVRERLVLRYYARAIDHLLIGPTTRAH
jgi:hypothetical protein